ncbi:phage holin [Geomicrobium sp. JCM 19039]|uniref:phage holin n=1 Tax=Geomicrobium sp. JCM 19039 TaxID=1460636 RepID=UPI00045F14A3|nr:phage holin [Geomicrobium sp. JCM 19039]GAK12255.1 hypothetical protein JCM19039_2010 [Geomicrobium sp. JCM 19039]
MLEALQTSLIEVVLSAVGILIAAAVSYFTPKIKRYLEIAADRDNLGIIAEITNVAVERIEEQFSGESGALKFEEATQYASKILERYGIEVSDDLIRAQIQDGWHRMQTADKQEV